MEELSITESSSISLSEGHMIAVINSVFVFQVNYVVQEAIVVIKDIFRKYPNKYESIISTLCENLDTLDEPEARYSRSYVSYLLSYTCL